VTDSVTSGTTGCSLGPEGPSVEIGIAASRMVSELFNLTSETRVPFSVCLSACLWVLTSASRLLLI
jgi:H+/Cl- antiporter ClcA